MTDGMPRSTASYTTAPMSTDLPAPRPPTIGTRPEVSRTSVA